MLTIKAEIKRQEQKADGTYNIKVRFTLNRKVKDCQQVYSSNRLT